MASQTFAPGIRYCRIRYTEFSRFTSEVCGVNFLSQKHWILFVWMNKFGFIVYLLSTIFGFEEFYEDLSTENYYLSFIVKSFYKLLELRSKEAFFG